MTPVQVFKKAKEKTVSSNLQDKREQRVPKYKLGDLVRTADIKKVLSKRDSTNHRHELYTVTQMIYDSIPTYRINYLPERYNENLMRSTKLTLEENNQVMEKLNLLT